MHQRRRSDPLAFDKLLSEKEVAVLELVGDLKTDAEIAKALGVSEQTILKYRSNIGAKLGVAPRVELERYAQEHGFKRSILTRSRPERGEDARQDG